MPELRQDEAASSRLEIDMHPLANLGLQGGWTHDVRHDDKVGLFVELDNGRCVWHLVLETGQLRLVNDDVLIYRPPA
jgi:hypothetical protein